MGLLTFLFIGFIAGLVARALMPGPQSMGLLATTGLGMLGSVMGGLISSVIDSEGRLFELRPSGLLMSVVGSLVTLALLSWGQRARA